LITADTHRCQHRAKVLGQGAKIPGNRRWGRLRHASWARHHFNHITTVVNTNYFVYAPACDVIAASAAQAVR
jgi:hypothetical protein